MIDLAHQRAVLRDAHDFYRRHLRGSWVPDYLAQRGLAAQLTPAQLGYAPNTWSACVDHLRRTGHDDATLVAAGLARESSVGTLIDALRDRLVVPVSDLDNHLVGFTARASADADPDTTPKWVNTATTDLFHKSQLLYALGEDRAALARGALPVIVEGAMDRLAVREVSGHVQVVGVAPLGTALTERHVDTLTDLIGAHRPLAVCFDSDTAGRRATLAAWDLLKTSRGPAAGALLHVQLPAGHDPADLVQRGRGDELRRQLMRPAPLANVVADIVIDQAGPLDHVGKQLALTRDLVRDVHHLHKAGISGYLAHIGQRLALDHHTVTREALNALGSTDEEGDLARITSAATPAPTHLDLAAARRLATAGRVGAALTQERDR